MMADAKIASAIAIQLSTATARFVQVIREQFVVRAASATPAFEHRFFIRIFVWFGFHAGSSS